MFPTVDEFEGMLLSTTPERLAADFILQGPAFAFRNDAAAPSLLTQHLSAKLAVAEENILVVGSAKTGFSLNPQNFPRTFSDTSDLDVVVIDEFLFDEAWAILLRWNYPRRMVSLGKVDGDWARLRRKDIYWGWFTPHKIRFEGISFPDALQPLRDFSVRWFEAFQTLSQYHRHPVIARRDASGRLYRTWTHAALYHEEGLRLLRLHVEQRRRATE